MNTDGTGFRVLVATPLEAMASRLVPGRRGASHSVPSPGRISAIACLLPRPCRRTINRDPKGGDGRKPGARRRATMR